LAISNARDALIDWSWGLERRRDAIGATRGGGTSARGGQIAGMATNALRVQPQPGRLLGPHRARACAGGNEESWLAEGDEREQSRRVALAVKLKFQTSQPSCTTPLHGRAGGVMEMATTVEKRRGARGARSASSPPSRTRDAPRNDAREARRGRKRRSGSWTIIGANAAAGAVAGTLVSVVLHPVDTIKVAVQADRAAREPLTKVVRKMLSARGVSRLYSGLSASLASSAPISAIYTAAYEAVKAKLLPMFPEERSWVAHCVAGGCASVATSFVYTPSECVKQRCQVSGAAAAWGATRAIVRAEGVCGLYKGWTAVLCRNIPQSAIKFFVFEQLMRAASRSASGGGG